MGVRADADARARGRATPRALLADLGHDVLEVDPRYPDPTVAFVPQFFAGIRTEADAVEHYDRLERRTRETYRLGTWVTPERGPLRAPGRARRCPRRPTGSSSAVDVLLTPATAHRPPRGGRARRRRYRAGGLTAMPAIAYAALWNLAGNPAASVPAGIGADGLPLAVQLVGRTDDEPTLLSLSAQLEAARPWPLTAPMS